MDRIDKVNIIIEEIMSLLPKEPINGMFWTNGEEILSESEDEVETIANLFDQLYDEGTVTTGYYNPKEDETDECVDKYTGWYYVNFA